MFEGFKNLFSKENKTPVDNTITDYPRKIGKRKFLTMGDTQSETILEMCDSWEIPLLIIGTDKKGLLVNKLIALTGRGNA